jgi:NAD(P)H-dependent FMN reductase
MRKIKLLAIPGSLRGNSSTHVVLHEIARMLPSEVDFRIYDGIGLLPHFDGPDEIPLSVQNFLDQIKSADGVLICAPEYAFGVPGSLKNALDWTVGTGDLDGKITALITASLAGDKAHEAMLHILTALSARVPEGASLLIPFIRAKIREGRIADEKTKESIQVLMESFLNAIDSKSNS